MNVLHAGKISLCIFSFVHAIQGNSRKLTRVESHEVSCVWPFSLPHVSSEFNASRYSSLEPDPQCVVNMLDSGRLPLNSPPPVRPARSGLDKHIK